MLNRLARALAAALLFLPSAVHAQAHVNGVYNSGGITVQDKGEAPLQIDGTGKLQVATTASGIDTVAIDQTTPGTTNGVAVKQIGSTTVATGNGVVGTGVQRVAIASDKRRRYGQFNAGHRRQPERPGGG
jgi:hypothetical protein